MKLKVQWSSPGFMWKEKIGEHQLVLEILFLHSVIAFDHRQSTITRISKMREKRSSNLDLQVDTTRSSARATFDYFSTKLHGNVSMRSLEYLVFLCISLLVGFKKKACWGNVMTSVYMEVCTEANFEAVCIYVWADLCSFVVSGCFIYQLLHIYTIYISFW